MKVLSLNAARSWLRFGFFDTAQETNNLEGAVDDIGTENAHLAYSSSRGRMRKRIEVGDHAQALQIVIALLTDDEEGVLRDPNTLTAIGHKVTHGGDRYGNAVIVDDQVLQHIEDSAQFAPRHVPLNLAVLKACAALLPEVPQIAVFDTGFHQKMPPQAYLYGLPYKLYDKDHIRRYGFHGIAHQYAALVAATHVKQRFQELKIITCHLDDEASICAIDHGRSIDTSMGMSPLEGLMMRSRSGSLDPSVILHLLKTKDLSIDQVEEILNQKSGLYGLSGIEGDFREIEEAANNGDHRAIMAIQAFCYQLRKYIGAYISAMSGLDVLVFSGSIGTGSAWVRSLACQGLSYMGINIDDALNKVVPPRPQQVADISDESSRINVLVIATDEERMIARETVRTLGYWNVPQAIQHQRERDIPIEVSAHHVHLSREDVDTLFGLGYDLSHRADLSQPGQYACEETVNLIGPRGRVERVRILGPERSQTQVEIAMTEEFRLGIKAPIRPSGDLEGSPGIVLEGLRDSLSITQGVICSVRHIHMSLEDALSFGLKDRDICMVRVEGDRTLIFGDVLVRVNPDYRLAMHIDTDEANAASIRSGMIGHLVGVQDR
jgi:acetate kinase